MNCVTRIFCYFVCHFFLTFHFTTTSPFQTTKLEKNKTQQEVVEIGNLHSEWLGRANSLSATNEQLGKNEDRGFNEAKMTTVEIISGRGYPVEIHKVTTDDGYILELHRIPHGKNEVPNPDTKKPVVFLQHGLLNTDNVWLITPNNQSLAYILADTGLYDVWLGNARGNTYSRKHVNLDPAQQSYWNFSFDEMGNYDIPAIIDYILTTTERSTMSYVGHSMGGTMFFVCMSLHPELNAKIDVMIGLAPAASVAESTNGLRFQAPFVNQLTSMYQILGVRAYEPVDSAQHNFRKMFCGPNLFLRNSICQNPTFAITGDDYHGMDLNLLPVFDGHNPAGTSVRTAAQFAQNFNAGQTFQRYDFGSSKNQLRYGQSTPPAYDLSKVTCPVVLFWGQNDKTVAPGDVAWLASKLGNLKSSNRVEDPLWNHVNHLFSPDAKQFVYDKFIPLLPSS